MKLNREKLKLNKVSNIVSKANKLKNSREQQIANVKVKVNKLTNYFKKIKVNNTKIIN